MRLILAFTILFFTFTVFAQKQNPLILGGSVKKVEIQETDNFSDEVRLKINLKMSARNQSSENVIVLTGFKSCNNLSVSKLNGEKFGVFALPTSSFLPKAKEINEKINKEIPPENFTKILLSNETWEFDYDFEYLIPRKINRTEKIVENEKGEKFTVVTSSMNDSPISLEDIKSNPQLNLTLQCSLEPIWLNEDNKIAHDLYFFQKLEDKWKKFGNFWTGSLNSEPILIDLGS